MSPTHQRQTTVTVDGVVQTNLSSKWTKKETGERSEWERTKRRTKKKGGERGDERNER